MPPLTFSIKSALERSETSDNAGEVVSSVIRFLFVEFFSVFDLLTGLVLTRSIFSFFNVLLMDNFTVPGELEGDMKTEDEDDLTEEGVETTLEATVGLTTAGENGGVMGSFEVVLFFEGVFATIFDAEDVADVDIILRVTEGGMFIFSTGFGVIGNCGVTGNLLFSEEISLTILSEESLLK